MELKAGCLWLLCGLAGCTMGPDYRKSVPVVPVHWQAEKDAGSVLKPVTPEKLKTWWKNFGDSRLDRLMEQALTGNLDLKIALTRIDQARADRRSIRAELFPQIDITAGGQRHQNLSPIYARGVRFNLFELGFDALWEVDLFGRLQRRLEAASADLEAAEEKHAQALVTLTAELARSYVEYRNLQNQLRITRTNLQTQQHTLALTERLFNEGVGTRHDVVRARAQAENTEAQIPTLEAGVIAVLRQLEVLIGRQPGTLAAYLAEQGAVPTAPGRELLASPAATIRYRPDLLIAERRLAAATAIHGAAIAELFPKISLSAFLGLRNTDIESLFKSAAFSYSTAANLMQPLLNFGRIQAGIDLAKANQKEAYLAYEKAVLEALRETETALTRYLKEEVRRQILGRSVEDQRESVRLSQLRYGEGIISFLDVLDAQRALYAAEIELARSEAEASTNLIAFYKALGGGANATPLEIARKIS
ncbi:efflux transporter outer membrane subunit [Methylobacter svalbardensis]|uniref:efflux transporter outer membrane subunit n=1 Tax=Methylobacter svalbardensis TaxID=3080016 RepID=UPI0030EE97B6